MNILLPAVSARLLAAASTRLLAAASTRLLAAAFALAALTTLRDLLGRLALLVLGAAATAHYTLKSG